MITGSLAGGLVRFWVTEFFALRLGRRFPWGTLVVNISGAFLAGLGAALLSGPGAGAGADPGATASTPWLLGIIGFLGSYTTVSSFSLETLSLARAGRTGTAAGNIALSLVSCLGFAAFGFVLGLALGGGQGGFS